jgi:nucleoside permease NupC
VNYSSEAKSFFEAMSIGATNMLYPVACIVANLIAFISFFALADAWLMWFFSMIGLVNFGLIVSSGNKDYL